MRTSKLSYFLTAIIVIAAIFLSSFSVSSHTEPERLIVDTYESFVSEWGPGPKLKKEFEKQCSCELVFRDFADGVLLLTNLRLKGDNNEAHIVLGLDNNLTFEAERTGYFVAHGIDTESVIVPFDNSRDVFLPYDYSYFSFVYNVEKLPHPPSSLAELFADDSIDFIIQDPRSSTPGLGFVAMLEKLYQGDTVLQWRKISPQIRTVTPGWSEAYSLFLKGEADMVVSYITSQAYHNSNNEGDKYRALAFDEGNYIQVETAVITKRGKDEKFTLAQSFLRFLLTDEAQNILATHNWMYPVTDYIDRLPSYFSNLPKVKKTLYWQPKEVSENRDRWIENWQSGLN